jgi:ribosomal protein L29
MRSKDELLKMAKDLSNEISSLRMDMAMKKVKNINELRVKMKNRARVLTLAHMKHLADGKETQNV